MPKKEVTDFDIQFPSLKYAKRDFNQFGDPYIHIKRVQHDTIDKKILRQLIRELEYRGNIKIEALKRRLATDYDIKL